MMRILVLAAALLLVATPAFADDVYLDDANLVTRLDELTFKAGISDFTAAEITTIKNNILAGLQNRYTSYDALAFSWDTSSSTVINFGLTAGPGNLGLADDIDYRNKTISDTARVYTANFDIFVDGGDSRAQQISEISAALTNTAAHELGHNLGLRHYDSYADIGTPSNGVTGGTQNTHIMGTGSTGMNLTQFKDPNLNFSDLSAAKLEFARGVLSSPLATTAEVADAGGTAGTAQAVSLSATSTSGYTLAANIAGEIANANDLDYFSFTASAGDLVTVNLLGDGVNFAFQPGRLTDAFLQLFDTDGTTLLASNNDIFYNTTQLFAGNFRTNDSLILNWSITADGTYYIAASAFSGFGGAYDLLIATTGNADGPVVPEPGSLALVGLGAAFVVMRRRKRA